MRLIAKLLHQMNDPSLSPDDRVIVRCQLAKQLEEAGNYEAALNVLGELWTGVGQRPATDGLNQATKAELLLLAGTLTGWLGSAKQIDGAQEAAKDLINESSRLFQALDKIQRVVEAQSELAICYWREGGFNDARVFLEKALGQIDEGNIELRALVLFRCAIVEMGSKRLHEALRIYGEAHPLFERSKDDLLRAKFHNTFANVFNYLNLAEHNEEYIDRALIEYTAASFHFEQAGHDRYQACVENNLGFLLSTVGKFKDAHEHLDHAQVLMTRLKDNVHLAQVDETRARVLIAEGRLFEAEKTARAAVAALEQGDELSLLAEALITHGIALARLNHREQAMSTLGRAGSIAERAGDLESAGLAALVQIEQLETDLSSESIWPAIERASFLFESTKDISILRRLTKAAFRVISAVPDWGNFSLKAAVNRYESHLIKLALAKTGGSVTRSARLLGFNHHQSLTVLIDTKHRELLSARSPVRKRLRSLIVRDLP